MAMQVEDVRDLLRIIRANPEWKAELRREVLGDELLALPDLVRQNSSDISRLTADISALKDVLVDHTAHLVSINATLKTHTDQLGYLKGRALLDGFFKTPTRFLKGGRLRKVRPLLPRELDCLEDADEEGLITPSEAHDALLLDLIVRGREGRGAESRDAMLAVEVSAVVGEKDIVRARRRADILTKAGCENVYAVAAGERIRDEDRWLAERESVEIHLEEPHDDD